MERYSHNEIERLVEDAIEDHEPAPRSVAFGKVLQRAGVFVRDYTSTAFAGDYVDVPIAWTKVAAWLHGEISRTERNEAILKMTIGEFLSLYVDTQPGLMDWAKQRGLIPPDPRNKRDEQYRK